MLVACNTCLKKLRLYGGDLLVQIITLPNSNTIDNYNVLCSTSNDCELFQNEST